MNSCLTSEQFQRLLAEQLDTAQRRAIDAHVDACPACQEKLARLLDEADGEYPGLDWQRLRPVATESVGQSVADLVRRLKDQLSPAAVPAGPQPKAAPHDIRFPEPPTEHGPLGRLESYHIVAERGRGAFGVVFQAYDEQLRSPVALKVLKPELAASPTDRARFEGEARKAAAIRHDHVVTIHRVGQTSGFSLPYFVMEYIDGESLSDRMRRQGALAVREAVELARQVALGLAAAHACGLVHRDINPANILVEKATGRAKITDFGLARSLEIRTERLTQSGGIVGTPPYMSPEQITAAERVDHRSDIYSLGVVLYELLTSERPFRGQPHLILHQVVHEEPRPPHKLNDAIPRDVETIALKCLAKEPGRRYQTAQALADDLACWLDGKPIQARPVSHAEQLWLWCRRKPVIAGLAAAVLLLAVITSIAYVQTELALIRQRRLYYGANLGRMQQAWESNNIVRLRDLLAETASYPERGFEWYYWKRLCHGKLLTLVGHRGGVTSIAFAPDGRRLVTGGNDGTARIWEVATGEELYRLPGHRSQVTAVAYAPDGRWLVTGSTDGTARIWDPNGGGLIRILPSRNAGPILAVTVTPDGERVVTGSEDGTVQFWDAANGQKLLTIKGQIALSVLGASAVGLLGTINAPGPLLAASAFPGKTWQLGPVRAVAVSPDGRRLVTGGSADGWARVWDADSGREILPPLEHRREVTFIAFSPNGLLLLIGSGGLNGSGDVKLWDAGKGKQLWRLVEDPASQIVCVALSPDGKRLATGGGELKLWDTATRRKLLTLIGNKGRVPCVALSPDGQRLATGSMDGTASIWKLAEEEALLTLEHTGPVNCIALSPDGEQIITGSGDGTVTIWDAASGQKLRKLNAHRGSVQAVAMTPDGQRIVTAGMDRKKEWGEGTARVWDLAGGGPPLELNPHADVVWSVAVTPDGQRIVTGDNDNTARVWDATSGRKLLELKGHFGRVRSVCVTPDGQRVVTGSWDNKLRIWDLQSGRKLREFPKQAGAIMSMAVTTDGKRIISGGKNGTVWETATGRQLLSLKGQTGCLAVTVTPDGRRIITGGADGTARVWDAVTGAELLVLKGHSGPVQAVAVTRDGRRIITGSTDGTVKIWEAATPDQVAGWDRQELEAERRMAAWHRPAAGAPGFIQDWLILAPLKLQNGRRGFQGLEPEQVTNEAKLRPRDGDCVTWDGKVISWRAHHAQEPVLDFNAFVGELWNFSAAYAVCYVNSDRERNDLLLQVGSDDEAKIYLNGLEIYKYSHPRGLEALDPVGPVTLHKGTNVLVFKVVNESNPWEGCIRIVDAKDNPAKGLRYSVTAEP